MATIESPTVLMRRPTSVSPPLPPSPAPSRVPVRGRQESYHPPIEMSRRGSSRSNGRRTRTSTPESYGEAIPRECTVTEDSATAGGSGDGPKAEQGMESWWRELLRRWRLLLTLKNSGSVARDHLASERTFLAYTRTSLTISSTGVALVQLFTLSGTAVNKDLERFARPLGAVMIGIGIFTLFVGIARYFLVQDALVRGVYPVARVSTSVLSIVILAFVLVVFVIVTVAR